MKKIKMSNYSILSILTVLLIFLLPFSVKADTADVDTHFDVRVVETADSKKGAEAVEVSVKNITNQTGKNVKAIVELPKLFADKLKTAAVIRALGTLEAGESKSFTIKLSDGSTTTLSTTGSSKNLPTTGETIFKRAIIVGVVLLIIAGFILRKRKLLGLLVALLALTGAALASASTYNHKATHHHLVKVVGQSLPFTTVVIGDFEEEASSSNTDNSSSPSTDNSSSTNNSSSSSQSSTASSDSDNPETPEEPVTPEVIKYTVSFDLNGGDSEAIPSQEVEANGTASVPKEPAKTGYRFDGWYEKEADELKANAWNFTTDKVTKATELYAKWAAKTDTVYTVEHYKVSSDGTLVLSETDNLTGTTDTTATAIAKTYVGYTYQASYDQGGNQTIASGNIASDGTLVLKLYYTVIPYNITYELDGGTNFAAAPTSYTFATSTITLGTPTRAGFTFEGWYTDLEKTESGNTITQGSTGNKTFYAKWTANTYSLTVNKDGSSWSDHGKTFTLKLASDESTTYTASGTTFSVVPDGTYNLYDSDSNKIISNLSVENNGSYTLNYYTVSFNTDGGSTAPESQVIYSGQNATAPSSNPTKDGNTFAGWVTVQGGSDPFTFTAITSTQTAYAKWTLVPLTITQKDSNETTDPGDEVTLANVQWRILKVTDGKALVIRENALTESEAKGSGSTSDYYRAVFRDGNYYFTDSSGANGYEAGGSNTAYFKGAIDYYYTNSIAPDYSDYVLPVNLNNPTFSDFTINVPSGSIDNSGSITSWSWNDFYKDTRFATTYGSGAKQAFVLSYGDIWTFTLGTVISNSLLDFAESNINYFCLRSAGSHSHYVATVGGGNLSGNSLVTSGSPVRPALWISLN